MIQGSGQAEYKFEEGMEKAVKTFRQRGTGGDALLIKIDHEADLLRIDEQFKGKSVEDMGEYLQEQSQPQCAPSLALTCRKLGGDSTVAPPGWRKPGNIGLKHAGACLRRFLLYIHTLKHADGRVQCERPVADGIHMLGR